MYDRYSLTWILLELKPIFCTKQDSKCYFTLSLLFAAVQNERDTISKRPRGEDPENRHGLTTNVLLSAEILSRPATSPPGSLLGYVLGNNTTLVKHPNILPSNIYTVCLVWCDMPNLIDCLCIHLYMNLMQHQSCRLPLAWSIKFDCFVNWKLFY